MKPSIDFSISKICGHCPSGKTLEDSGTSSAEYLAMFLSPYLLTGECVSLDISNEILSASFLEGLVEKLISGGVKFCRAKDTLKVIDNSGDFYINYFWEKYKELG